MAFRDGNWKPNIYQKVAIYTLLLLMIVAVSLMWILHQGI